jgi:hypothetical protein
MVRVDDVRGEECDGYAERDMEAAQRETAAAGETGDCEVISTVRQSLSLR